MAARIISLWRMEDVSGNLTDAYGGNNLTSTAITYSQPGKVNNAVSFNGTTSQAVITNANQTNLDIAYNQNRTFSFWFKTTTSTTSVLATKRTVGDSEPALWQIALLNTGGLNFVVRDSVGNDATLNTTTTGLNDGNWHFVVATFIRSVTGMRFYIDNVEDASSPVNASSIGACVETGSFALGTTTFGPGFEYNGLLDEFVILDSVISASQRAALWNGGAGTNAENVFGIPSILDKVISGWRLNDISGNLVDSIGSNDLTATDVTYSVPGKVGTCVSFSGVSTSKGIITNANQVGLNIPNGDERSVAFWFKTSSTNQQIMLDKRTVSDSSPGAFQYYLFPSGAVEIYYQADGGSTVTLDSATTGLNDGNWHLIVTTFTRTTTGLRLFIDNVEDANSPKNSGALGAIASSGDFTLGCSNFSTAYQYTGQLDEVVIWNRVISPPERSVLWNGGAGTNIFSSINLTAGVISAWQMENASGNLTDTMGLNTLTASNLTYHQTGKVNFAIGLNGSSSSATITDGAQTQLNIGSGEDRTIAVWFKSASAIEQTVFGKPDDSQGGQIYEMIMDSPGGVNVVFGNFSGSFAYVRSSSGYLNGQYHLAFLTFTRENVGLRLFVDNVEERGGSQPSPANAFFVGDIVNASSFLVGKRFGATSFWNGNLDEFIIWNRVLTSTERRQVWSNGNGRDIFNPTSTPEIVSVNPLSSYVQGGVLVEITGHQFSLNIPPTITFDGALATNIQVSSSNYLTCVTPSHVPSSSVTITLTNSDSGFATFSGFKYNAFFPTNVLRPPKYYRNSKLTFAQRRGGVNNYIP